MKQLVCIVCPKGCRMNVDEENDFAVTGNGCPRGAAYGKKELTHPTRVVTSTVRITGGAFRRCPVKTDGDIPKELVFPAMALLNGVELSSPVRRGDVVLRDIFGTGVNFIVTRDL